jgi:translocator protein
VSRSVAASRGGAIRPWQLLVVLTTVFTLVMNALANILPIAGRSTGEISDAFLTVITPAGYVFAIWLVIYLGLIGYTVWQALPEQGANPRAAAVAPALIVANLANGVWILAWHYLWFGTSLVLMLVLLAALCGIYLRLRQPPAAAPSRAERVLARGTFSVYLGWITVATVANVSVWLVSLGWDGGFIPPSVWGALTLVVASALGVVMLRRFRDLAYALVLVWAFIGIVVARSDVTLVAATAVVGVLALLYAAADTFRHGAYTARR